MPMGKRLYEARAPQVTLSITQDLIDAAIPCKSNKCMIAEALLRAVPQAVHVKVDTAQIAYSDPRTGLRHAGPTPRIAQMHILAFDAGRKQDIRPFRVILKSENQTTRAMSRSHGGTEAPGARKRRHQRAKVHALPTNRRRYGLCLLEHKGKV